LKITINNDSENFHPKFGGNNFNATFVQESEVRRGKPKCCRASSCLLTKRKSAVKHSVLKTIFTMVVVLLAACAPPATPTEETLPPIEPTESATQVAILPQVHPLDTLTNIPEIDVIINAVASGDPQELRSLFEYTTLACWIPNALGGPPPCRENEAEGTLIEVLPFLGAEGSFLRKDEAANLPGLNATGLYAVYRVPDSAFSDENYPAGDFGIVYLTGENIPEVILQATNGKIVRIDYIFGYPEANTLLPEGVTDFVLEPVSQ
jgi:hypothetical protein